ncbi:MAG: Fe-S oxidoreductase [Betaproteobacteria bacterium]|nr:Fe-S oxidoreductase [Betaproteobacteria bacterium]
MSREGNLEAPTRHPLDWKTPEFYDKNKTEAEMARIFDICHGCRRCFNLCNAFPMLFDAVDATPSGELHDVPASVMWDVVDQCYLCDMCYMTKCPYTPPHPFNLDFPHTMLRAKAVQFKEGKPNFRDRLLTSTDALGKLASIPVVVQAVNAVNRNGMTRALMEKTLGIHRERLLPTYTSATFRKRAGTSESFPVRNGERTPGKVVIYATCYVNYNEPGIGHDLVKVLEHNEIPVRLLEKEACCGMPKLELGDLDAVAALKEKNIPFLAEVARSGYAILTAIPSCTLMYKQELPLLFPDDPDVKAVAEAMYDPFEYLSLRHADGLLKTNFVKPLGTVSYHVPCHLRVQNIGLKTKELLQMVPDTTVNTVERCAGHDGTWGVKSEHFEMSMKIGRPVFNRMKEPEPDYVSSDCPIASRHILQGMKQEREREHPISLLRIAYGLE